MLNRIGVKWIICMVFFTNVAFSQTMITKVIELHYRQASDIINLVKPLLQDGEEISGSGQTLIVKVTPDTLTQLRAILHKLDTPPIMFTITIHQGNPNWLTTTSSDTRVYNTPSQVNQRLSQSVQVINGESAFIATSENVPVISNVGIGLWTGIGYQRHNVQNGLLVEPELQGEQVRLKVRRMRERPSNINDQAFKNQEVVTTVMVPLDEWKTLGTAQGAPVTEQPTRTYSTGNQFAENATLYVKVSVDQKQSSGISK